MPDPSEALNAFAEGPRWSAEIDAWRRQACAAGLVNETSDGEVAWLVFLTRPRSGARSAETWGAAWGALERPLRMAVLHHFVSLFPATRVRRYALTQQRVDALIEAGRQFEVVAENLTRLVPGEAGLGEVELTRAREACARGDRRGLDAALSALRSAAPYDPNHRD